MTVFLQTRSAHALSVSVILLFFSDDSLPLPLPTHNPLPPLAIDLAVLLDPSMTQLLSADFPG